MSILYLYILANSMKILFITQFIDYKGEGGDLLKSLLSLLVSENSSGKIEYIRRNRMMEY